MGNSHENKITAKQIEWHNRSVEVRNKAALENGTELKRKKEVLKVFGLNDLEKNCDVNNNKTKINSENEVTRIPIKIRINKFRTL